MKKNKPIVSFFPLKKQFYKPGTWCLLFLFCLTLFLFASEVSANENSGITCERGKPHDFELIKNHTTGNFNLRYWCHVLDNQKKFNPGEYSYAYSKKIKNMKIKHNLPGKAECDYNKDENDKEVYCSNGNVVNISRDRTHIMWGCYIR